MPRTPLLREIKAALAAARHGAGEGAPAPRHEVDRRQFLAGAGALAGAAAVAKTLPRHNRHTPPPRIAIIGAGIAGVTAALELQDYGFSSTVYEASGRVGGRMDSDTTSWLNGQVTEHCGELIDTGHLAILGLADRFGLTYDDVLAAQPAGSSDTYFLHHGYYSIDNLNADLAAVNAALQNDVNNAGFPTLYNAYTKAGFELDHMSVYDWIESRVPGGHRSRFGSVLDIAYNTEYGALTTDQSALNLVYLLGYQPATSDPGVFNVFGLSDERFHITGGNERLPQAIAAALNSPVQLNTALRSIAQNHDGTFTLGFAGPSGSSSTVADHVIMTIPFSVLRTLDYQAAGFSARKRRAITQLGYGQNGKLQLQFTGRPWTANGPWGVGDGSSFSDTGYQNTWEPTRAQPGATGILNNYTGVTADFNRAISAADSPGDIHELAERFLFELEPVFPGISRSWTGRATLSYPANDPLRLGSYAYWKVGQYTGFSGVEREPEGNCHFAGEHTSILFQGFMEGGAEEGQRAADEILANYLPQVSVASAGNSPDPGTLYTPPSL